jgi:hypothetical protein
MARGLSMMTVRVFETNHQGKSGCQQAYKGNIVFRF